MAGSVSLGSEDEIRRESEFLFRCYSDPYFAGAGWRDRRHGITEVFPRAAGAHSALTRFCGRTDHDIDAFLAVAPDMIRPQVDRGGARYQAVP